MRGFDLKIRHWPAAIALAALGACAKPEPSTPPQPAIPDYYTYQVVHAYPHSTTAFTEGLVYFDGHLYESTGLNGQSTLSEEDLQTGKVLQQIAVPAEYFGEGLAILNGKAYQLTWQAQKGFVYDLATFNKVKEFSYTGEGWGMTTDGQSLIMSDGTSQIRFLDPETFAVKRTIVVSKEGVPMTQVNELEYIKGEIFANVWQTDYMLRIDPANGNVKGVIDFHGLLPANERTPGTDVLNGVAYDAANDRIFVTGKNWPKIFEVKLVPITASGGSK